MPPLLENRRPPLHPGSSSYHSTDHVAPVPALKRHLATIKERGVNFLPRVAINEVPNIASYSEDETDSTWYNFAEISSFEQEAKAAARRLVRKNLRKDECGRGLESRTPEGFRKTRTHRVAGVFAVLSEQHRQDQLLMYDDLLIAEAYMDATESSRLRAQDCAAIDALEAHLYQSEDSNPSEKSDDVDEENIFECSFFSQLIRFLPREESSKSPFL